MSTGTMESAAPRARVLFVDDEPRVLTTMRMLFRGHYDLLFAEGGNAALTLLRQQPVDVIVSDQRMPGMSGIELLRVARELSPGAIRILLTGYSDLNAIIGSINEGEIYRFVNKPWSNQDLATTLARAVAAARSAATAAAAAEPADAAGASEPAAEGPGILVLDDDPRLPPRIRAILGDGSRVFGAHSLEQAVGLLERERIGVVISDTRVQRHPVVSLIGTLKQHQPELVSVILTERADAGTAIDLINQGQIYRFITKPIVDNTLKIMVNSALRQHGRLAQTPQLHRRYEVAPAPEPPPASAGGRLLERIRSLRSWVTRRP